MCANSTPLGALFGEWKVSSYLVLCLGIPLGACEGVWLGEAGKVTGDQWPWCLWPFLKRAVEAPEETQDWRTPGASGLSPAGPIGAPAGSAFLAGTGYSPAARTTEAER